MSETVLARIAGLKAMPVVELKKQWRDLFERWYPFPWNRTPRRCCEPSWKTA